MEEFAEFEYGTAILSAFEYLLESFPECFVIGQGLWSPWYVGNTMSGLDKKFGIHRVIDTPVSESACNGLAVGAAVAGMKPIVVHPRMDFLLYGLDALVNEAAKWSYMFGGQSQAGVTVRAIINRGGEQGAQHSQALHSWFAHIPGLRVVMPYTVADARDLLIAAVLCRDPVIFIDDRWLYETRETLTVKPRILDLNMEGPKILIEGSDVTIVGSGYSTKLAIEASELLSKSGISAEVIDLRVLNPFIPAVLAQSVTKTRRLVVVDGSWANSGISAEVIASVTELVESQTMISKPIRITLPPAPAPAAKSLQNAYYPTYEAIYRSVLELFDLGDAIATS